MEKSGRLFGEENFMESLLNDEICKHESKLFGKAKDLSDYQALARKYGIRTTKKGKTKVINKSIAQLKRK